MLEKLLPFPSFFIAMGIAAIGTGSPLGAAAPGDAWFSITPYRSERAVTVSIGFLPEIEIQGWSFGLVHDPRTATLASFGSTPDLLTVRAGGEPDFLVCQEAVDPKDPGRAGIVQACLLDNRLPRFLPYRAGGFPVLAAEYDVREETTVRIGDGLKGAGEPVQTLVTVDAESVYPVALPEAFLVPKVYDAWFTLSPARSDGTVTVSLFYGPEVAISGWAFSVSAPSRGAWIGDFRATPDVGALRGGSGPEFWLCERLPVDERATLVCSAVLSADGSAVLPPLPEGSPLAILEVDFKVMEAATAEVGDFPAEAGPVRPYLTIDGRPYTPRPLPTAELTPKVPEIWVNLTPETSDGAITASIDSRNAEIQGWSFGLCHDPEAARIVDFGATPELLALRGGNEPDFYVCELASGPGRAGIVQVAILSYKQYKILPPRDGGFPVLRVEYGIQEESTVSLCSGLEGAGEPVTVVFTSISQSIPPARITEARLIQKPYAAKLSYTVDPPISGEVVTVKMATGDLPVQGWSFALCGTAAAAEVQEIATPDEIAGILDGNPPDFILGEVAPADPYTVVKQSVVLGLGSVPVARGPYPDGLPLLRIRYRVDQEDDLKFCDSVGVQLFDNRVAVDGILYLPAERLGGRLVKGALGRRFIRGDADLSGKLDLTDPITILSYLFLGAGPIPCLDAGDVNDVGPVDITDPICLLMFLFLGGPAPPMPYPYPGEDMTPRTGLGCERGL